MVGDPGIDLGAIDASGGAHVGDHAVELASLEQAQGFGAGFGGDDTVTMALEDSAHQSHDGGLVLNEEDRCEIGFGVWLGSGLGHLGCTPATAPKEASEATGRRTIKVAPSESRLL